MRPGYAVKMKLPASRSTSWSPRSWRSGTRGARRAARICSRVQRTFLSDGLVTVFSPIGLNEDAIDLFEIHDAGLVANGFDEGTQTEVAGAAQQPFARTNNQGQRLGRESIVAQAGPIELAEDESLDGFGSQPGQHDRVGDAGADFLVDGQRQRLQQGRLADKHQVVRAGKVLAEQAQFAQAIGWHEMGVVNDRDQHLPGAMDGEGFLVAVSRCAPLDMRCILMMSPKLDGTLGTVLLLRMILGISGRIA